MLEFKIINPIDIPDWDMIIKNNEGGNFFLTKEWSRVLCETYKYTPKYIAFQTNSHFNSIIPIMEVKLPFNQKRASILPFTDYVNPIIDNNYLRSGLFGLLISLGRKEGWGTLEIKNGDFIPKDAVPSDQYILHTLKLESDGELVFRNFSRSTRRNIRFAIRRGVRVTVLNTADSMRDFYHLVSITRKRHGLPPQPYAFFKNMQKLVLNNNMGEMAFAFYKNKPIAGAMFLHFKNKVYWKYAGSDPRYHSLKANNLVLWEMIKLYCRRGYEEMSFGKSEIDNTGLCQYKTRYGTESRVIKYYVYDFEKNTFSIKESKVRGWHNLVFRHTPLPLLKKVGSTLYRYMG